MFDVKGHGVVTDGVTTNTHGNRSQPSRPRRRMQLLRTAVH